MRLRELRNEFTELVAGEYDQREAEQVFYLVLEDRFGLTRAHFMAHAADETDETMRRTFQEIAADLNTGKPVQYILGTADFDGHIFVVNENVLIPRPETEELVRWIAESEHNKARFIDIGTGSGCIPLALAFHLDESLSLGLDVSEAAVEVARENAVRLGRDSQCRFAVSDILNDDLATLSLPAPPGEIDFIVSNPPYISPAEASGMELRVTQFEPHLALFYDSPLTFYRVIASKAQQVLHPEGRIYFEIHENKAGEVAKILKESGFGQVEIKSDMHGKNRMIRANMTIR